VPVDVLDRRLVPPRDLVPGPPEHCGDLVPLCRARSPAAEDNGQHALFVEPGTLGQLLGVQAVLQAEIADGLEFVHRSRSVRPPRQGLRPNCGPWPYTCATGLTWPHAISPTSTPSAAASR